MQCLPLETRLEEDLEIRGRQKRELIAYKFSTWDQEEMDSESSNWWELMSLVEALEEMTTSNDGLEGKEILLFTDIFMSEAAYYRCFKEWDNVQLKIESEEAWDAHQSKDPHYPCLRWKKEGVGIW